MMNKILQTVLLLLLFLGINAQINAAVVINPNTGSSGSFGWNGGLGSIDSINGTSDSIWSLTLNSPGTINLAVKDGGTSGDAFELVFNGVKTSWKDSGFSGGYFFGNYNELFLTAGTHTFSLNVVQDCCGGGAMTSYSFSPVTTMNPNDILGGFLDLNNSTIDYVTNKIVLKFTVPPEQLSKYFNKDITLARNGDIKDLIRLPIEEVKKRLQLSNPVVWDLTPENYYLKNYLNLLSSVNFNDTCLKNLYCMYSGTAKAKFQSVYDKVRNHASDAILTSRSITQTKPTSNIICTNQQGVKTACNNFFYSAETGVTSKPYTAAVRTTLTHRIVDFDKIAPISQINGYWKNTAYGKAPQGDNNRIPLLLIHGWQGANGLRNPAQLGLSEYSELQYWRHYLDYYLSTPALQRKYHVYLYHYPTYKHVTYNAKILGDMLGLEIIAKAPNSDLAVGIKSGGKGVVVLAHSMGGLIARSAIEEYQAFGTNGERLRKLITLDTPHHGSPASNTNFASKLAKDLYTQGSADLHWDNFDDLYSLDDVNIRLAERQNSTINAGGKVSEGGFDAAYDAACTSSRCVNTQNPWLAWLNDQFQQKYTLTYKDKYVLYAGWMQNVGGLDFEFLGGIVNNGASFGVSDSVLRVQAGYPSGAAEPVYSALFYMNAPAFTAVPFDLSGSVNESSFYTKCASKVGWYPQNWFGGESSYLRVLVLAIKLGLSDEAICGNSILITKTSNHPFHFQYRVFWDYDHENMVNGAYAGKAGVWDKYIGAASYLGNDVSADSSFLPSLKTSFGGIPDIFVRKNYVDISLGFRYGNESYVYDDDNNPDTENNPKFYNPLKLEPLFNVLYSDLITESNKSFIVP